MNKLRPEVGDTVVLHATVSDVSDKLFRFRLGGESSTSMLTFIDHIKEIIPKPWEPKVGDKVFVVNNPDHKLANGRVSFSLPYTVLCFHQVDNRRWAVLTFRGDIPKSVYAEDLRPCAD